MSRSKTFHYPLFSVTSLVAGVLVASLLLHVQGYCASSDTEMEKMAANIMETIFAPWITKTVLGFSAFWGVIQTCIANSPKPLITWGGIGLIIHYVPQIITWLSS